MKSYRMIHADDDSVQHILLQRILDKLGYPTDQLEQVGGGDALVARVRESHESGNRYDTIFTDNSMLVGDEYNTGIKAIAAIREFDPDTPIVMMSGDYDVESEALKAGATVFMKKPFLINSINDVMGSLGLV